jgi:hypothetical protein
VRLLPGDLRHKPIVLLAALILAGCGGDGSSEPQVVRGNGYRFQAPSGWEVTRTLRQAAAADGEIDRVEVTTFRLMRPYRPALFAAAAKELDGVAGKLARELKGKVTSEGTVRVFGRPSRTYRISYDGRTQELTFVLDGRREYQLLCRREADGGRDACAMLVRTFALA